MNKSTTTQRSVMNALGRTGNAPGGTRYRPDIDGLRAIAVMAVILFHAGISGLPGGFVGVDIFFVISGYLIGGQIFREVRAKEFSFAAFYARRVRRILPALYALIVVLAIAGSILMTPQELKELGKESFSTIFGASNVFFYTKNGYFAPTSEYSPLLMTWSLGVEEQFYLLFPFVALFVLRLRQVSALPALITLSVASFAGSLLLTSIDPKAAFYLFPTRGWELGLGVSLVLWEQRYPEGAFSRVGNEIGGLLGMALLLSAIVFYKSSYAFPGVYALLPTLGAAILINTTGSKVNTDLLSRGPLPFIGRISYSWYLWHWPVIFFNRLLSQPGPGLSSAIIISSSFFLAVLSWSLVEQPFRHGTLPRRTVLALYAAAALLLAAPSLAFYRSNGWPERLSSMGKKWAESAIQSQENPCVAGYGARSALQSARCLPEIKGLEKSRLLVLGDSHASAIAPGFALMAMKSGLAFGEMTKSSCPPLWKSSVKMEARPGHWSDCIAFQESVFTYVERHPEVRVVVLAGYWSTNLELTQSVPLEGRDSQAAVSLFSALDYTITRLEELGRQVVLVQDVPSFRFDPYARAVGDMIPARAVVSKLLRGGRGSSSSVVSTRICPDSARGVIASILGAHRSSQGLDPVAALCGRPGCSYEGPGELYYLDYQHLTISGALEAVRGFRLAEPATLLPTKKADNP